MFLKDRITGVLARDMAVALKHVARGDFKYRLYMPSILHYLMGAGTHNRFISGKILGEFVRGDCLDFNGVRLPLPMNAADTAYLFADFRDILYHDLFGGYYDEGDGPYEWGEVKISKGDVVIDAGANIGMFAAFAAKKGATVYAFEPIESVRRNYLEKTALMNPGIKVVPLALSDTDGYCDIYLTDGSISDASLVSARSGKKITIQTITLDSFVKTENLRAVNFVKADIEGAERLLLSGAQNTLREFCPKLSLCTYHLPDDKEVLANLVHKANPAYRIENKWSKMFAATY
ncbi:MAG: FkbM family methyltransferase [Elusimicrobiaceae bacterium]